jgi:hypothetical protein
VDRAGAPRYLLERWVPQSQGEASIWRYDKLWPSAALDNLFLLTSGLLLVGALGLALWLAKVKANHIETRLILYPLLLAGVGFLTCCATAFSAAQIGEGRLASRTRSKLQGSNLLHIPLKGQIRIYVSS